jgi:CBS domain containing-hemolysin-like protein
MVPVPLGLALVILGVLVNAAASLAEAAILSTNRLSARRALARSGRKAAVMKLLERPAEVLSTIVFVNVVASVVAAAVGAQLALQWWGETLGGWALVVGMALVILVLLVVGEILPKAVASLQPVAIAEAIVRPVHALAVALTPIVRALEWITGLVLRPFGWRGGPPPLLVSEEEVQLLLNVGREQGVIEPDELAMIGNIFELEETTAREVMTPRVAMVCAPAESDPLTVARLIVESGYSRIPIYEESIDHIVGVVYAKDLLAHLIKGTPFTLREIAREPYIVPPGVRVDQLLHDLQEQKKHMAIVMDEYGGVEGLVTIEDLIEEIVGEIQDEYDQPTAEVRWLEPGRLAIVPGRLTLADFSDLIGHQIEAEEVDTVGGLVADRLGKPPEIGDTVTIDGVTLQVREMSGRGIRSLLVELPPAPPAEAGNAG